MSSVELVVTIFIEAKDAVKLLALFFGYFKTSFLAVLCFRIMPSAINLWQYDLCHGYHIPNEWSTVCYYFTLPIQYKRFNIGSNAPHFHEPILYV